MYRIIGLRCVISSDIGMFSISYVFLLFFVVTSEVAVVNLVKVFK